jgi:thioester reductase-like protein
MIHPGNVGSASGTLVMTGATGFLGSHLLGRLLHSDNEAEEVVVLVRDDPGPAAVRLRTALAATGIDLPGDLDSRVRFVRADLTQPRLGLDTGTYGKLAEQAGTVWHVAAETRLTGRTDALERVNVQGTRQMLDLVSAASRPVRLVHVSTAYVAGGRRRGHVAEDELDDAEGFLTQYEASKFRAEGLVRAFAAGRDNPVTVFRPSVLVDDRPPSDGAPRSPHTVAAARLALLGSMVSGPLSRTLGARAGGVAEARMPGDPDAHMNVLPVQHAADTMLLVAKRPAVPGVTTYHVTHPHQTPVRRLLEALTHHAPWLRVRLDPEAGGSRDRLEDLLVRMSGGLASYGRLHRTYDRGRCAALGLADPPELDTEYLRASFAPPRRG